MLNLLIKSFMFTKVYCELLIRPTTSKYGEQHLMATIFVKFYKINLYNATRMKRLDKIRATKMRVEVIAKIHNSHGASSG